MDKSTVQENVKTKISNNIDVNELQRKIKKLDIFRDEEITDLKKRLNRIGLYPIILSELFITAYDTFHTHNNLFSLYLEEYEHIVDKVRHLLIDYDGGKEIGDSYISQKIKQEVDSHRKEMSDVVILFSRVFLSE